jgi:hypothetical protein
MGWEQEEPDKRTRLIFHIEGSDVAQTALISIKNNNVNCMLNSISYT